MNNFYTGVGSRKTPQDIIQIMRQFAMTMAFGGWTLRSGGAIGADKAFEDGCGIVRGPKEIYYPGDANDAAMVMAEAIHPAWHRCSDYIRKLHARNCFQVLGRDLRTPSKFLICWTLNGEDIGGTRTAIVLARNYGIDVFNLGDQAHLVHILKFIKDNAK
jgi:hypothetical protein